MARASFILNQQKMYDMQMQGQHFTNEQMTYEEIEQMKNDQQPSESGAT